MLAIKIALSGGLAILAGVLVLFFPKLLRIAVGLYLIAIGILTFF